jgi:hypothetical protein
MKKLFQFILMIIMGLVINSCYYDAFPEEVIIDDPGDTPTEDVSYQSDIIPLWVQCVGCHSGNEPPDLRDANSYNALLNGFVVPGDADASILYKSLLGIDGVPLMPPGSQWPDTKINLVEDWINQGALNN